MFLDCSPCKWAPVFLFPHFGFSAFNWHTAEMSSNEQLEPSTFLSFVLNTALFFTPRRMLLSSQGGKLSAMGKIETASSDCNSRQRSSNIVTTPVEREHLWHIISADKVPSRWGLVVCREGFLPNFRGVLKCATLVFCTSEHAHSMLNIKMRFCFVLTCFDSWDVVFNFYFATQWTVCLWNIC